MKSISQCKNRTRKPVPQRKTKQSGHVLSAPGNQDKIIKASITGQGHHDKHHQEKVVMTRSSGQGIQVYAIKTMSLGQGHQIIKTGQPNYPIKTRSLCQGHKGHQEKLYKGVQENLYNQDFFTGATNQ